MAQPFYGPPEVEYSYFNSIKGGIRGLARYGSNAFVPGCTFLIQGHPSDSKDPKQKWFSPQGGNCCSPDHFNAGDNLLRINIRVDELPGCAVAAADRWCEVDPKVSKSQTEEGWEWKKSIYCCPVMRTALRLRLGLCWDSHTRSRL